MNAVLGQPSVPSQCTVSRTVLEASEFIFAISIKWSKQQHSSPAIIMCRMNVLAPQFDTVHHRCMFESIFFHNVQNITFMWVNFLLVKLRKFFFFHLLNAFACFQNALEEYVLYAVTQVIPLSSSLSSSSLSACGLRCILLLRNRQWT